MPLEAVGATVLRGRRSGIDVDNHEIRGVLQAGPEKNQANETIRLTFGAARFRKDVIRQAAAPPQLRSQRVW